MTLLDHRFPIESAAEFLRGQALTGMNCGDQASLAYIGRCSILHKPTNTCVVFTRDDVDGRMTCWHLAVFRKGDGGRFVQMEENLPKQWALAVFGQRQMKHVRRVSTRGSADPRPEAQEHLQTSWHYVIQVAGWPKHEKEPLIVVPGDEKAGSVLPERTVKE